MAVIYLTSKLILNTTILLNEPWNFSNSTSPSITHMRTHRKHARKIFDAPEMEHTICQAAGNIEKKILPGLKKNYLN